MDMELHADLRSFLLKKTQLEQVVNLSSSIFTDGKIPAMLLVLSKTEPDLRKSFHLADLSRGTPRSLKSLDIRQSPQVKQKKFFKTLGYRFLVPREKKEEKLLETVRALGCPLSEALSGKITRGLVTGQDKYFIFETLPEWLPNNYLRTIVKGREIQPFLITGERYLLTLDETPFGDLLGRLKQRFKSMAGRDPQSPSELMELRSPRSDNLFVAPKILLLRTGRRLVAAPDFDQDLAAVDTLYIIRPREEQHMLFMTALLNSCLYNWLYQSVAGSSKDIFPEIRPAPLHILPFIEPPLDILESINTDVEAIRDLLTDAENVSTRDQVGVFRKEIDDKLFDLYKIPESFREEILRHR